MTGFSSAGRLVRPGALGRGTIAKALAALAIASTVIALAGVVAMEPAKEKPESALPVRGVTDAVYPGSLASQLQPPADNPWTLPVAVVPLGGSSYILDAGNARILQFDAKGQFAKAFDASSDPRLQLKQPMAMVTDGKSLYIANSLLSQVLVVDPSNGAVQRVIQVPAGSGREKAPRIIGVALLPDGQLAVSDADNHRVLVLGANGELVRSIGTGNRASGKDGFNVPASLTTDSAGNLYVVDTLNGRVAEFARDGSYVRQFGKPGATAGGLQRPKGVVVDPAGRVFVSDGLASVIDVFAPDGAYLGMIGRKNPGEAASPSLFRAPADLWLDGPNLYVADRIAGVFVIRLESPAASSGQH